MNEYFFTIGLNPYDKDIFVHTKCFETDEQAVKAGVELKVDYVYLQLPENGCRCIWKSENVLKHERGQA